MSRLKIGVAVAHTGTVKTTTMQAIVGLIYRTPHDITLLCAGGCYVERNRTTMVKEAIAFGMEKVLFVDSDMFFAPDCLNRLLSHDKDIIGAAYNGRIQGDPQTTVKQLGPEGIAGKPLAAPLLSGVFPAYAVGTGFMLIDCHVFQRIPQPWFHTTYHADGEVDVGDDVWFCLQAQKAGFQVWCDNTLNVKHTGDFNY